MSVPLSFAQDTWPRCRGSVDRQGPPALEQRLSRRRSRS